RKIFFSLSRWTIFMMNFFPLIPPPARLEQNDTIDPDVREWWVRKPSEFFASIESARRDCQWPPGHKPLPATHRTHNRPVCGRCKPEQWRNRTRAPVLPPQWTP